MNAIVGIHGVAQQRKGPEKLRSEWEPSLRDGVALVGGALPEGALSCAFYGELFRPKGAVRGAGDEHYRPSDVTDEEADLLALLLREAARAEPDRFPAPDADLRFATPSAVQRALRLLLGSRFLTGVSQSAMIGDLKQVRLYLNDPGIRTCAQQSVDAVVTEGTRVLIAHSLGSVVVYEALHNNAGNARWANVKTLITLGSPLGIPNLIFERLQPAPVKGKGRWPAGIDRWTNISDEGDIVALVKSLGPLFGSNLVDIRVHNGSTAHDVSPYLTARETGAATLHGLA